MTTTAMPVPAAQLVRRYYVYGGIYTLSLLDAGLSVAEVFTAD